jgi:hypothetical protein
VAGPLIYVLNDDVAFLDLMEELPEGEGYAARVVGAGHPRPADGPAGPTAGDAAARPGHGRAIYLCGPAPVTVIRTGVRRQRERPA